LLRLPNVFAYRSKWPLVGSSTSDPACGRFFEENQKHEIMKKILFFTFLTAFAAPAFSQETAFGLKAGLNLTNLKVDDPQASYDSRTGYHAGVFLRGRFDKIAIQPEVLLFTQSNEINYSGGLGSVKESFTYVSVPFMLKFYPAMGLNIQAGPQFGFLIDGQQDYKTPLFSGTKDIKDSYKSNDVSVSVGAGWDFDFGLSLDVRYNIGVKDINDVSNGEEAKSRVFLVSLGWNFLK
jgi:Outer membrane protein beta-barrel domain